MSNLTEEKANIRCNRCKCFRYPSEFLNDKGRELKSCIKCRTISAKARERYKCIHGKAKNQCVECGGVSICNHGRRRNVCKECGGEFLCQHGKQKHHCKECGGASICEHNRLRNTCKDCGGASICEHGRMRIDCKECGGSSICEHGRRRCECKECGGGSICDHNRLRNTCKECMSHEQKIEYIQKKMIYSSRHHDKEYNRYDADNFIDKCFLEGLFEDSENCHYCGVEFTYNEKIATFVTIERLNNSIGHIKSNCVLACWDCNSRHKSRDESDEEKTE